MHQVRRGEATNQEISGVAQVHKTALYLQGVPGERSSSTDEPGETGMDVGLEMWVIYDHPKDFPNGFIARLWIDEDPQAQTMTADTLDNLRELICRWGCTCHLVRYPDDDPVIVETWI